MSDVQIHWFSIVNSVVVVFFLSGQLQKSQITRLLLLKASAFDPHDPVTLIRHPEYDHHQDLKEGHRQLQPRGRHCECWLFVQKVELCCADASCVSHQEDTMEESGWKNVHGDVFRPPQYPMILSSLLGSGIQLFCMVLIVICKFFFHVRLMFLERSNSLNLFTCERNI